MAASDAKKKKAPKQLTGDQLLVRYLAGLLLVALGVLIFLSMAVSLQGAVFAGCRKVCYGLAGGLAILLPVIPVWGGVLVILSTREGAKGLRAFLIVCLSYLLLLSVVDLVAYTASAGATTPLMSYIFRLNVQRGLSAPDSYEAFLAQGYNVGSGTGMGGGLIGMLLAWPLWKLLGVTGGIIASIALLLGSLALLFQVQLKKLVAHLKARSAEKKAEGQQEQRQLTEREMLYYRQQEAQRAAAQSAVPVMPKPQPTPWYPQPARPAPQQGWQQPQPVYAPPVWAAPQPAPQAAPEEQAPAGFAAAQGEDQFAVMDADRIYFEQAAPGQLTEQSSLTARPKKSKIFGSKKAAKAAKEAAKEAARTAAEEAEAYTPRPGYYPVDAYDAQPWAASRDESAAAPEAPYPPSSYAPAEPAAPETAYAPAQDAPPFDMPAEETPLTRKLHKMQEATAAREHAPDAQPAYAPASGYGSAPDAQPAYAPAPGYGSAPDAQPAYDPAPGYGSAPDAQPTYAPAPGYGSAPDAQPAYDPAPGYGSAPDAQPAYDPAPGYGSAPDAQPAYEPVPAQENAPRHSTAASYGSAARAAREVQQPMPSWSEDDGSFGTSGHPAPKPVTSAERLQALNVAAGVRPAPVAAPSRATGGLATTPTQNEPGKLQWDPWAPDLKLPAQPATADEPETPPEPPYVYPPMTLIKAPTPAQPGGTEEDELRSRRLEETLQSFKIPAKVRHVTHGPAISRFELEMAAGIKVNKITELDRNIAMNMEVKSIRIEAPIPGKALVGVEVPNKKVQAVTLREVLETDEMKGMKSSLGVALGKDIAGLPIVCDLARMPHLLIAGATGSGKSVCVNAMINSILYRSSPKEVRMILVDPKVVELQCYNGIPHLLIPVVSDPHKAAGALSWAVTEMMERYQKFTDSGVREISGYNAKLPEGQDPMPRILIVIDELADLMMKCKKEVEEYICRLAQLARAAGIHLVVATQRPSVDVITGLIKANIPSRIAFKVSSNVDSRTILDRNGAEKLLGYGDMLYLPNGEFTPVRVQGCFLTDSEVNRVTDFIRQNSHVEYDPAILDAVERNSGNDEEEEMGADAASSVNNSDGIDPLLSEAADMALMDGQTSISMLQRRLRIGYARAGRLIDEMTRRGIISSASGAKPRQILVSRDELDRMDLS